MSNGFLPEYGLERAHLSSSSKTGNGDDAGSTPLRQQE
jgi:hypothetical protein